MPLTLVAGGILLDPVVDGDLVYIPSGRIVSTWDYADPAAPRQIASTGDAPANGELRGLTRWADYLYASWQTGDDHSGVAVYWLRDPRKPELVSQFDDYTQATLRMLWTVAAANGHLYLFDSENGIFDGDLSADAVHPSFQLLQHSPVRYEHSFVDGNYVYVNGSIYSSVSMRACGVYDVSVPDAPVPLGADCGSGDPLEHFRSRIQPPLAASFGLKLSLYDLSDLQQAHPLGSIDTPAATDGFIAGDYAYSLGFDGIDIHDISDRSAPVTVGHSPIALLGANSVSAFDDGALVLTSTDHFTRLDVSDPLHPVERSVATPPGGAAANDVAMVGGKAILLQEGYGLGIADPASLAPLGRFDAALPEALNQRDFEQFAIDGERAYLAAWGYGLVVVDVANVSRPRELGRVAFPYASAVAAHGDYAYIGTRTNGGILQVVDVSDPANPVLRGSATLPTVDRLVYFHGYVFAADEVSGVHVYDVADPDAPFEAALWDDGCTDPIGGSAFDIAIDESRSLGVVACGSGMHVVDLSRSGSPLRVGGYPATWTSGSTVAIRGDRAWFASTDGLVEFDIADPADPQVLGTTDLAHFAPRRLRATDDGRLFAFFPRSGVHVFGTPSGTPEEPLDSIFADGFDPTPTPSIVSTYDDMPEADMGTSFHYNGVTYRELNEVEGMTPDGQVFLPGDYTEGGLGNQFLIDDVTYVYNDFPAYGSAPNSLNFGNVDFLQYGPNTSLGALASLWLDLDAAATAASFDLAYYEYGPWEGIVIHVDAIRGGEVVASTSLTIAGDGNPDGRDHPATGTLSVQGAPFDTLHVYSMLGDHYTAPRVIIDDLSLTPATP